MQERLTPGKTWGLIASTVILHDLLCPPGSTLSDGAANAIHKYPHLTRAAIGITALHLAGALPPPLDPFHQALKFVKH